MKRHILLSLVCINFVVAGAIAAERFSAQPIAPVPWATSEPGVKAFRIGAPCEPADVWPEIEPDVGALLSGPRDFFRWPMRGNVPANTYLTEALGPVRASPSWTFSVPGGYVWRPAVAPDGTTYVNTFRYTGTVDGELVALYPNGQVKWSAPLTNAAGAGVWTSVTPVLDGSGNIFLAWAHDYNFEHLTALSFDEGGHFRWRYEPNIELEHTLHQEPVLANGVFYATMDTSWYSGNPTHRCSVIALDPANGDLLWRWPSPNTDTFFDGPAIGNDGALYLASASNPSRNAHGFLYRILPTGNLDWSEDLGWAGSNAPPALDAQNSSYFGDLAGIVFKYGADGTQLWSHDTASGRVYTSPGLDGNRVLVGAADAGLQILDAETGDEITRLAPTYYPMGRSIDRAGNVYIYCYDGPGTIFGFGRGGHQWWTFPTGQGITVNSLIVGGNGLVLVGNGASLKAFPGNISGDVNCDGAVNFDDIDPFVLALSDPAAYHVAYPSCDIVTADIDGDGAVNFDDIDAFVATLSGEGVP